MANELKPMQRTISLPSQQVTVGSGINQLAQATSEFNKALTDRLMTASVEEATRQGEQEALAGQAPQDLALPVTKATKAYNDAVTKVELNRTFNTAEQLVNEAFVRHTDPATFTKESPAKFRAELDGIKDGLLKNARPDTHARLTAGLDSMANHMMPRMLQHAVKYDNAKTQEDLKQDLENYQNTRRNLMIAGDADGVAFEDKKINDALENYGIMNQSIKDELPQLKKKIEENKKVDEVVSGLAKSYTDNTTYKYLSDLAENKQGLPYNTWEQATKAALALDQKHAKLKNDMNAAQVAEISRKIDNGQITSEEQILDYQDLTKAQQIAAAKHLDTKQAKTFEDNQKVIVAQKNILKGRGTSVPATDRNKMFSNAVAEFEERTGRVATLADMEQIVLGTNEFAASGMTGVAMGANVPAFDSILSQKLTGRDPVLTAQAATVFNHMTRIQANVAGRGSAVSVEGKALSVANLFNELNNGGTTPEQAAQLAIHTVLDADEPEIKERSERFKRNYEYVNPYTKVRVLDKKFKEAFGTRPEIFKSDRAYRVFQDTFRAHYLNSNSEEVAFNATKDAMRSWGTSEYFDQGYVGNVVPEKELPITQVGHAFSNQIVSNIQSLINRNKRLREEQPNLGLPVIEWADKSQELKGNESEDARVLSKFLVGAKPRIKIDGHETDVVLIDTPSSRLGNKIHYNLGVYDKFNVLHTLQDPSNTVDGVARFMPLELEQWAPEYTKAESDKKLREQAKELYAKEQEEKDPIKDVPSIFRPAARLNRYLQREDKSMFERLASQLDEAKKKEEGEQKIFESLKESKEQTKRDVRQEATEADHVGLTPDTASTGEQQLDSLFETKQVAPEKAKQKTIKTIKETIATEKKPEVALPKSTKASTKKTVVTRAQENQENNYYSGFLSDMVKVESGGQGMDARSTSGAIGKYQFIKSTWNKLIKKFPEVNLKPSDIYNEKAQDKMIHVLIEDNKEALKSNIGRTPENHELYIAHNIGAGNAAKLINASSSRIARVVVGDTAARNNKAFYFIKGRPVTVKESLNLYKKRFK